MRETCRARLGSTTVVPLGVLGGAGGRLIFSYHAMQALPSARAIYYEGSLIIPAFGTLIGAGLGGVAGMGIEAVVDVAETERLSTHWALDSVWLCALVALVVGFAISSLLVGGWFW